MNGRDRPSYFIFRRTLTACGGWVQLCDRSVFYPYGQEGAHRAVIIVEAATCAAAVDAKVGKCADRAARYAGVATGVARGGGYRRACHAKLPLPSHDRRKY